MAHGQRAEVLVRNQALSPSSSRHSQMGLPVGRARAGLARSREGLEAWTKRLYPLEKIKKKGRMLKGFVRLQKERLNQLMWFTYL